MLFGRQNNEDDTVVRMLASALKRDIAFGVLAPDQKLKLTDLRTRYGGSNHSMRETLRLLEAEGMVEAINQRGFRVTSASHEDREDIALMRHQLEDLGLQRSMAQGGVDWEAEVIAALHRLDRAEAQVQVSPDDQSALDWDAACAALAEALLSACGSLRLIDTARRFQDQSRRFRLSRLREGRMEFSARAERRAALRAALLAHRSDEVRAIWAEDIAAEMR